MVMSIAKLSDERIGRRLRLRDLHILMSVARCGGMGKAAAELAVSQPAISKAIADMEHTFGVRLLDRTAQGVEPTLYGRALLKWGAAVFDDLRQGVKEIEFLADPAAGELRIGPAAGAGLAAGGGETAASGGGGAAAAAGNGQRQARHTGPAATADGRVITLLCNVASAAETRRGLATGAEGVGLLRTEIPFTGALAWPTLADHRAHLAPILSLLAGRPATVRLLDFSGDKIPPFLAGPRGSLAAPAAAVPVTGTGAGSGLGVLTCSGAGSDAGAEAGPGVATGSGAGVGLVALLAHPTALRDQLRAILEAGHAARLAVLIPMVSSPGEVDQVRAALAETAAALGVPPPRLGIMVELAATAAAAETFAPAVDFFSIGTNDLAGQVLGLDRRDPAARPALAADPRVLGLIGHVTRAAYEAGIGVSVCGDAAADAQVLPLLVGLGVDTLSVPAARVERVRSWLAALDAGGCADLAARALAAPDVDAVWKLVPAL